MYVRGRQERQRKEGITATFADRSFVRLPTPVSTGSGSKGRYTLLIASQSLWRDSPDISVIKGGEGGECQYYAGPG
ncbi:hypothetical protein GCM10009414_13130 [Tatumella terrea]